MLGLCFKNKKASKNTCPLFFFGEIIINFNGHIVQMGWSNQPPAKVGDLDDKKAATFSQEGEIRLQHVFQVPSTDKITLSLHRFIDDTKVHQTANATFENKRMYIIIYLYTRIQYKPSVFLRMHLTVFRKNKYFLFAWSWMKFNFHDVVSFF